MPHIEELAPTAKTYAPGWAYVPDTGYDPSKAPIVPTARKRTARLGGPMTAGDSTARQNNALIKRLAELDRDTGREVHIAIPSKGVAGGVGSRSKGKTAGTRKILLAQRTFANFLADEEALAALEGQDRLLLPPDPPNEKPGPVPSAAGPSAAAGRGKTRGGYQKHQEHQTQQQQQDPHQQPVGRKGGSRRRSTLTEQPSNQSSADTSVESGQKDPQPLADPWQLPGPSDYKAAAGGPGFGGIDDSRLLQTVTPRVPSDALMAKVLSQPTLSYNAACVGPSTSSRPRRWFCELCGYWGTIRCLVCGARVCGLACKKTHDEDRCQRYSA